MLLLKVLWSGPTGGLALHTERHSSLPGFDVKQLPGFDVQQLPGSLPTSSPPSDHSFNTIVPPKLGCDVPSASRHVCSLSRGLNQGPGSEEAGLSNNRC